MVSKNPQHPNDPLAQQLRESLRRQRPFFLRNLIWLTLLVVVPLGLFLWLVRPRGAVPLFGIVAADILALPGEEVQLRAYLEPLEETESPRLDGHEVFFEKVPAGLALKVNQRPEAVRSDSHGEASQLWRFPAQAAMADFLVRYVDLPRRRRAEAHGRVFFRPADTPLLLLDGPAMLSPASAATWAQANILEIPVKAEAAAALTALQDRPFQIVYLALDAQRPGKYRQVRAWLDHRFVLQPTLPRGPVLCPSSFATAEEPPARQRQFLADLRQHFKGPMVALTADPAAALVFREQDLPTLWLGQEEAPPGSVPVPSWNQLGDKIPNVK